MKRFQRILAYLPPITDGENATSWCVTIAHGADAKKVDLVTCIEDYLPAHPRSDEQADPLEAERERLTHLEKRFPAPTETEVFVETENSLKFILNRLSEGDYDLVVLPVNDLESRLFAERLARKSPVGILAVPPDCPPRFSEILAAIDLSNLSTLCLGWAEAFASLSQGETNLEALHVIKVPRDSRTTMAISQEQLKLEIERASRENLSGFITKASNNPEAWLLNISEHPLASVEIVRTANENAVDLVVIGSHGRGALSVALLGGQTAEVIRNTTRPVLVVKKKNENLGILRQLLGRSE